MTRTGIVRAVGIVVIAALGVTVGVVVGHANQPVPSTTTAGVTAALATYTRGDATISGAVVRSSVPALIPPPPPRVATHTYRPPPPVTPTLIATTRHTTTRPTTTFFGG